jgi:cyclophilin family peptidyl-prolyl cis-trans isomerase
MHRNLRIAAAVAALALLAGCRTETEKKTTEAPSPGAAPPPAEQPPQPGAETYRVRFDTSKGPFVVEVHPEWAPVGSQRFRQLIEADYYNGARFFRVVPNFVIQFGIAATPVMTKQWDKPIEDDPVRQTNRRGTLAFATMGPNTRTAQVFINLRSNQMLDDQGFAPFAMVTEGLSIVDSLYAGYGEAPNQEMITKLGNAYLTKNFPQLDYIRSAEIVQ